MSEWLFWPLHGYLEKTLFLSWGSLHPWQLLSWWLLVQEALCQSQLLWEAYTKSGRIRFDLGKPQWTLDALAYSCLGWPQPSYQDSHSGLEWGRELLWCLNTKLVIERTSMSIWNLRVVHISDFSMCMSDTCDGWNLSLLKKHTLLLSWIHKQTISSLSN